MGPAVESTGTTPGVEAGRLSQSISSQIGAYLTLVRVPNCLMIGFAVLIGETIGLGRLPSAFQAILGFLTAFLLLAGTMVLNDIQDLQIDRVNSPDRPLSSGRISIRHAYEFSVTLSVAAMISSIFLGLLPFITALAALALMIYYNTRGKKTGLLGNAVVSFNVALPFFFGGLAVNNLRPLLFIFFLLAFLANLAREIAKGISDIAGDRLKGVRTVAATRGSASAARITASLFVVAVFLSGIAPRFDNVSVYYYPIVAGADLGFLYSSYRLLRDQSASTVHSVITQVLVWMLLGLVGFLVGGSPVL